MARSEGGLQGVAPQPVSSADRMDVLDVLRGVAIYGILLYNIGGLSGWDFAPPSATRTHPGAQFDGMAVFALEFLVQGKFYSLFSFLFGVGFAVFLQRAQARGANAVALFKRRLVGLTLIGLAHTLLIWFGDILLTYAVLGFGLIPFARYSDRVVRRSAFAMLLAPVGIYALLLGLTLAFAPASTGSGGDELPAVLVEAVQGFTGGNYVDVVAGNAVFSAMNAVRRLVLMFFPRVFGMFLLGFWAGRVQLFANVERYAPLLRRTCGWGFAIGLPLALAGAWLGGSGAPQWPTWRGLLEASVESVGTPALALAYVSGLVLMFRHLTFRRFLVPFAPVGRTALSNYLLQSIVGVMLFYGIGFGLFGMFSLPVLLAGASGFFLIQIVISRWWLRWAAYGPAEWIWRQFTYGRRFPIALRAHSATISEPAL